MSERNVITATGICKSFFAKESKKETVALENINIAIPYGELTALIGPDGAGKTTFLRMVCGLLVPSSGSLDVLGIDVTVNPQEVQDRISYMPQKFGLYEDLSVSENMNLYADLHGVPLEERKERFDKLLEMTGLAKFTDRLAGKLSGGMKQKLGLACTLVRSPELLLLDEPTVGVDPLSRRELWEILQQLVADEGLTVLVSTAYMDEAELCSKVIVVNDGKVLIEDTPENLRQLARGKCYKLAPPKGIPSRILQAALLDDVENVIDAVPEGGEVRFIARAQESVGNLQAYKYFNGLVPRAVDERLEDSVMIVLREKIGNPDNTGFEIDFSKKLTLSETIDIEVKDLVRKFGDFIAVNNTSFQVRQGEIFGLLGPNGAGKTTTFKMLCGLLPASSGYLSVAGVDLRTARTQARANIGYVAQKFSLYSTLTVDENMEFYGGAYGLSDKRLAERMTEVKNQFGLTEMSDKEAGDLPGGYKQRLSMGTALLHEPRIIFLDEPTSGIDPLARRTFWQQITALAAEGKTIIITTHFMEEAEYCDRIMIQDQGKMLAIGTPSEIRAQAGIEVVDMNEAFIAIVGNAREKEV
ncbi:MAG: ABC transporter ATP-binding protein [Phascolarctobacterium sp.]|nr:ABC transporter ATP-binding protein [Phascolarctobacterium sp.]